MFICVLDTVSPPLESFRLKLGLQLLPHQLLGARSLKSALKPHANAATLQAVLSACRRRLEGEGPPAGSDAQCVLVYYSVTIADDGYLDDPCGPSGYLYEVDLLRGALEISSESSPHRLVYVCAGEILGHVQVLRQSGDVCCLQQQFSCTSTFLVQAAKHWPQNVKPSSTGSAP